MHVKKLVAALAGLSFLGVALVGPAGAADANSHNLPSPVKSYSVTYGVYKTRTIHSRDGEHKAKVKSALDCVKVKVRSDWYGTMAFALYSGSKVKASKFVGMNVNDWTDGTSIKTCVMVGKHASDTRKLRSLGYVGPNHHSKVTFQIYVGQDAYSAYRDVSKTKTFKVR
ncbi:hypothetical protein [Luteimicrobium xylanilyticum]|nr:hypothetical protein [Luteimicrobium xylanilyticum]